jgi:carbonic anhydrase
MERLKHLFDNNQVWAAARTQQDPAFFERLVHIQRPHYLWIGCADSRVPANEIVGLPPGEVFVHRNVANLVQPDDVNAMAVVQYAVGTLGVEHIIVCGHYGCGGVHAVLDGQAGLRPGGGGGYVDDWLAPLRRLAQVQRGQLDALDDPVARWARLCELSVVEQVRVLSSTPVVRNAWSAGRPVTLHGWIYSLRDGLLHDLEVTRAGPHE